VFAQFIRELTKIKRQHSRNSRRMKSLGEHIRQADIYFKTRDCYKKWSKMKDGSRKSDDYFEKHRDELDSSKNAYRYISDAMNGNKDIPLDKWRKEYAELRERYELDTIRINKLSDEIKAAERIMRGADRKHTDRGGR
jgi:hypothetical protein